MSFGRHTTLSRNRGKRASGKRSRLEEYLAGILGKDWDYEKVKIPYIQEKQYVPDFTRNETIVEAKGYFPAEDRRKMLDVKRSNPKQRIIIVFGDATKPIRKGSKTSYGMWCNKNGFEWLDINKYKGKPKTLCKLLTQKKPIHGLPGSLPTKNK